MAISTADPQLNSAVTCMDAFYARMFRDWPLAFNEQHETFTLSYSGDNRLTGANHLWLNAAEALRPRTLNYARQFFERFGAAWSVIYTDTHLPEAAELLDSHGFHVRWRSPLMVLDRAPELIPIRPDARVIRAHMAAHLTDIHLVMSEAFATRRSVNERVARLSHIPDPDIDHYLIYDDDGEQPVVCATVVASAGMAGIWNVGTRRNWRRQGYAATIMHGLLADQAARGRDVSMLMASAAGKPLYEKLGYRDIGITYYVGPPYHVVQ